MHKLLLYSMSLTTSCNTDISHLKKRFPYCLLPPIIYQPSIKTFSSFMTVTFGKLGKVKPLGITLIHNQYFLSLA